MVATLTRQATDIDFISTDELFVDLTYQRSIDKARVKKISAAWDWNLCGYLAVSARTSGYVVLNGQHRLEALKLAGYSKAPCQIYRGLSRKEEAHLFSGLNAQKAPTHSDIFKARLEEGDEAALGIKALVESYGFELSVGSKVSKAPKYLYATIRLESLYRSPNGTRLLGATLQVLRDAWEGKQGVNQERIMAGLAYFIRKYRKDIDLAYLSRRLSTVTPSYILMKAASISAAVAENGAGRRNSSPGVIGEAFRFCYNLRRKDENKLGPIEGFSFS